MSGIHMAESQISIMDGKLEKRFQNAEKGTKKLNYSVSLILRHPFFHVNTLEIRLSLTFSGILQSFGPESYHGEVGNSWPWANLGLSCSCCKHFN